VRYDTICRELAALDADVIGLNEVTASLLERMLREEWVRDGYTASAVPGGVHCSELSTLAAGGFGNLLLSRIPPVTVEYVSQPGDGRQSHVMSLCLPGPSIGPRGAKPLRLTVSSTHLTACPWLMEGRRKVQLEHITSTLTEQLGGFDGSVVMGDYNFHREAENASIPDGWREVPAVVALGETWDFAKNAMLPHYLPLRNFYNGLGLGTSFGWPTPMRLDRVLVRGSALDVGAAKARLFVDQPCHERARGRTPLPQTGRELRDAHRCLPWQQYLFPSDHFGIFVEIPMAAGEVL